MEEYEEPLSYIHHDAPSGAPIDRGFRHRGRLPIRQKQGRTLFHSKLERDAMSMTDQVASSHSTKIDLRGALVRPSDRSRLDNTDSDGPADVTMDKDNDRDASDQREYHTAYFQQ